MLIGAIIGYVLASILIQAPVLWIAGRIVVGEDRAKLIDAVFITIAAVIANTVIGALLGQTLAGLVQLVVYLYLIVRYYETDWVKAAIIAVLNTVIGWIIMWILITFIGISAIF